MNVFLADEQDEPLDTSAMRVVAEGVLTAEGLPDDTEMSLVFIGPDDMSRYNQRFMNRRGPTDVLAFPLEHLHPGRVPAVEPNGPPLNLGDVFVCPVIVRSNADEAEVPFSEELHLIVVHGILHLLGYDHFDDLDAAMMEAREAELMGHTGRVSP